MLKIICGEKGYCLDIDGIESDAHRYGHAIITAGPSGALYGALLAEEPETGGKPQLYKLIAVDSIADLGCELDEDVEGGYIEDPMYEDEEAPVEVDVEAEEEEEAEDEDGEEEEEGEAVK